MDKILRLYTYVDGGTNDTPFPDADNPIEIGAFRYDAKRMGGAPTITASVYYPSCLDGEWTDRVYAKFNYEKYFLKQTPTSSYSNEDSRYKHELTLVSERAILDNVLFYDAVIGEPQGEDKPVSNSTKFVFFGTIDEFANRLNASLQYAKLQKVDSEGNYVSGYRVIVDDDDDITSEAMLVSFEDQYFSNAIQESYNTFKVPYYFVGEDIHFGKSKNVVEHEFAYGVDNALLSITKNNANNKIVNRVTGKGSSENLPYYYPNRSPKGNIYAETNNNFSVEIFDYELYSNRMHLNGVITKSNVGYKNLVVTRGGEEIYSGEEHQTGYGVGARSESIIFSLESEGVGNLNLTFKPTATGIKKIGLEAVNGRYANIRWSVILVKGDANAEHPHASDILFREEFGAHAGQETVSIPIEKAKEKYHVVVTVQLVPTGEYQNTDVAVIYTATYSLGSSTAWVDESGKSIDPISLGLLVDDRAQEGDTITQRLAKYITPSTELLPPIYRNSFGEERFYNAINGEDGYKNEKGEDIIFNHPYVEGQPREHIFVIDDIKPTIKDKKVNGLNIDMFSEFGYDDDDDDSTYVDEKDGKTYYKHPYFFGKLRKLDFNLFEHSIEGQAMMIEMTSGDCGACKFEIGATEGYPQYNPVQVHEKDVFLQDELLYGKGTLKKDSDGNVICGLNEVITEDDIQAIQQDTINNEVWIALKKEEDTYGEIMPNKTLKPKSGDTFVITGINLPQSYIEDAEQRLESEIIQYLKDNNDEKFNFGITLSRIFFAENPTILEQLTENASLNVLYNGVSYPLFVSSISYNMEEDDILPEVRVELVDSLSVSQNAIQAAVSQVKADMSNALANIDFLGASTPHFLRKDTDDEVRSIVDFKKGIKFGEGGKVEIMDNNSAKLTIEYLEVTKKATFTSLEIQEKTHVGGQMLVTPASMNCGEVEELEDSYRCYFQTKGLEGNEEIFNQFVVGDQAICQTFNAWGSKYYWRLVTGVGEDYIDLSKTDCDEGSGVPEAGDRIIQMGNRDNEDRQNAIVIAAHGDNSPYIVQYKGISNFDLPNNEDDERITTLLSPTKNILTGQVIMQAGSKGLESFAEWAEKQKLIDSKASAEELEAYAPIKEAIENNFTVIDGGLIQSALLMLGYQDEDGVYHIMSGTNGVYNEQEANGGIAAWYGGEMSEEGENRAKAVIRFDGSGYFADKNFTWNSEGEAEFAGGLIKITKDGGLVLGDNVQFGVETKATVGDISYDVDELRSMFSFEDGELCTIHPLLIKNNLFVEGDTATGGEGQNTTPSINLDNLDDVTLGGLRIGDLLLFNGSQWVNAPQSEIVPNVDLSDYYTKQEIDDKGYATKGDVSTEIGKIDLSPYAKTADVNAELEKKANANNVYSRDEIDGKVTGIGNSISTLSGNIDTNTASISALEQNKADKSALKEVSDKVDGIESTLGDDVSGKINTWNEIVDFLDEYNGSEDLATILSKMQGDINSRALGTDLNETIARVADNEDAIEDLQGNKADKATTLAGYGITNAYTKEQIDVKLTGITTDIDHLENSKADKTTVNAIDDRLKAEEDVTKTYAAWWKDLMTYVKVVDENVVIDTNLLVEGESATRGVGDPSTGGGIDLNALEKYLDENGYVTEQDVNDAIDALNIGDYAKTSEVERLFTALNIGQYAKTADVNTALGGKVDKVSGKGLSTNDFTTALLNKLNGIADWALAASKPSYNTSEVVEQTNLYFTNARAISAVMGASAIGSTSAYPYWDGSAWKTKTLGNLAFVNSLSKSDVGLGNVANETYAGGTAVTLNGFSKAKSTASFYAPTSAGTVGYFLKSQGAGDAPIWAALGALATKDSLTYSEVGVTKDVITELIGTTTYAPYNANGYLPLSGGEIKGTLTINRNPSVIEFKRNNVVIGYLGVSDNCPIYYTADSKASLVLTEGNYSSYALPLSGGTISGDSYAPLFLDTTNAQCRIQFRVNKTDKALVGYNASYGAWLYNYASSAYLGVKDDGTPHYNGNTLIHSGNIESQNAGSATKLKTARTIWGQSFDGTSDISASLYLPNASAIYFKDTNATNRIAITLNDGNGFSVGFGMALAGYNTSVVGNNVYLRYGKSANIGLILNSSGNVTVGGTDLAGTSWKAYINGSTRISNVTIASSVLNINRNVITGALLDSSKMGFEIEPFASYVTLKGYNTSGTGVGGINIASSGNVLIGTTTDNSSGKLQIDGGVTLDGYKTNNSVSKIADLGATGLVVATSPSRSSWGMAMWTEGNGNGFIQQQAFTDAATTYSLCLNPFGGNVGIGTKTPENKLDVNGTCRISGATTLSSTLTMGGSIVPETDSASNLGGTSKRWAGVWTDEINGYTPITSNGGTIKGVVNLNGNDATNVPLNIVTPSMGYTGYIRFGASVSSNELGLLGFSAKGVPAMVYEGQVNTLIHSGNIGSQFVEGITTHTSDGRNASGDIAKLNSYYSSKGFRISRFSGLSGLGTKNADGLIVNWPLDHAYGQQWYIDDESHTIQVRYVANAVWSNWKTIAFTDSTVAAAQKLVTSAGADVLTHNGFNIYPIGGIVMNPNAEGMTIGYNGISWHNSSNTWTKDIITLNSSGNVGIGTSSPEYKLDVDGTARISGAVTMSSTLTIGGQTTINNNLIVTGDVAVA